ncbi:ABC transporter permease [Nocardiopsis tropica]|jgi:NitT/TauT family transport system permease protein|uniref:ABC transporter permease n=1 Tax=Streptomonospora nanhaiensis TaxID=1323731 RepID=A0ABY6YLQ0_9ACTN|nr:ABC transporter permease [Streptomonospora nanhaiensis]MEE2045099.1 ABC transporter permease [Nocardiopsis tropica]WAE73238.1 ABC transporter permease [Streptomonospora nanhaiensis]
MATQTPARPRPDREEGPRGAAPRVRRRLFGIGLWMPATVAVLLCGLAWTAVAEDQPYLLPPLREVGTVLVEDPGLFLGNAWSTLRIALLGVSFGAGTAFVLSLVMSEVPVVRRAIMPLAVVLNVTPVVALAPALVVAFGFGMAPKVIVTAIITFFPVLINMTTGLRSVPVPVLHVFSTLHASRLEVLLRLRVPSSLPYALAALRVVFPLSIVGAVVAEFVAAGSSSGLGTMIRTSAATARLEYVYAAIACLAAMGVLMLALITVLERRLLFWHESQQ